MTSGLYRPEQAADAREELVLHGLVELLVASDGETIYVGGTHSGDTFHATPLRMAVGRLTEDQMARVVDRIIELGWNVNYWFATKPSTYDPDIPSLGSISVGGRPT